MIEVLTASTHNANAFAPIGHHRISSLVTASDSISHHRRSSFPIPGAFATISEETGGSSHESDFYTTGKADGRTHSISTTANCEINEHLAALPRSMLEPTAPLTRTSPSRSRDPTSALANDREAQLRTPRPQSVSEMQTQRPSLTPSSSEAAAKARIMQWQRSREASDATLDAREQAATTYPSDSLGRVSVASSAFGTASEFGHGFRKMSASESGVGTADRLVPSTSMPVRRGQRKVAPPELLVVVRPPPSKQSNPLNLQIQLVTPQGAANTSTAAAAAGRTSGEFSRTTPEKETSASGAPADNTATSLKTPSPSTGLRRSNSVSSNRSAMSETSSAGLSTTSASSASRRVTPLYNLCFHSIKQTSVTDAGTDQKVAKFGRRGVEIDGFGELQPHELFTGVNDLASLQNRRRSFATGAGTGSLSGSDVNSPDVRSEASQARSTDVTSAYTDQGNSAPKVVEPPTSFDAMSPQAKEGQTENVGLGSKLLRGFKRFSVNAAAAAPASLSPPSGPPRSAASMRSASTIEGGAGASLMSRMRGGNKAKESEVHLPVTTVQDEADSSTAPDAAESDIPQLVVGGGIRPDGSRRAQGYYWTVKRWNRRLGEIDDNLDDLIPGRRDSGTNPILNSVWKRFNVENRKGGSETHPPSKQIPVRFEWTRTETRKKSVTGSDSLTPSRHGRAATDIGSGTASRKGSISGPSLEARRLSSVRASLDARAADEARLGAGGSSTDLLRPPTGHGSRPGSLYNGHSASRVSIDQASNISGEESDPEDSETKWACHLVLGPQTRIPIGSLAPTPHHPKLVAQLTVPYPLPDLSQSGLGVDGAGLTREELKDIISVTSLFVIVREGFGGLAKRRKGDSLIRFGAAVAQGR